MNQDVLQAIGQFQKSNRPYAIGTVVEVVGSTSAKTGSKIVIDADGLVVTGWVGGGCAESTVCSEALACLKSQKASTVDIDMDDEVLGAGMPCGGHMRVFIEPVVSRPTLWIMGHGEVAEQLCRTASMAGFIVVVNDPGAVVQKFPDADRLIVDDIDYSELKPKSEDFVVIATQHKGDHESTTRALDSGAQYIALIASRKRSRLVLDYLRERNYTEADLQRVVAPCGIDIGARVPVEIALSVLAEVIMLRRGGGGGRLKDGLTDASAAASVSAESAGLLSPALQSNA